MFTINLHNLIFHSYHGVHDEEATLGNTFVVNVAVSFTPDEKITTLQQTINYASVYKIIKHKMIIATPLLETLVQDLAQDIYEFDRRISSISVSIEKKNPPIPNMHGSVSVTYKKDF